MYFQDRSDAGQKLAHQLAHLQGQANLLVLGIPRGGVVVAYEVARALNAELDVCLTHKLGAPGNPELAIGAVAEGGTKILDAEAVNCLGVPPEYIETEVEHQRQELAHRGRLYRGKRPPPELAGRVVIVIDDGVATGATMAASLQALAVQRPALLIAAIPVAPQDAIRQLRQAADQVECVLTPDIFWSVGAFYGNFTQVSDEQVIALLNE